MRTMRAVGVVPWRRRACGAACAAWLLAACGGGGALGAPDDLATRYLAIAEAGNRRLDVDYDGLRGRDRNDLAAARSDLRDAAATERRFDQQLVGLPMPPPIRATALALVAANEPRAALAERAAAAATLAALHAFDAQLAAADAAVEAQVRALRRELGLPPPDTG